MRNENKSLLCSTVQLQEPSLFLTVDTRMDQLYVSLLEYELNKLSLISIPHKLHHEVHGHHN